MSTNTDVLAGVPHDWPRDWHDVRLVHHPLFASCLQQHHGDDAKWEHTMIASTASSPRVAAVVKRWAIVALAKERVFVARHDLTTMETCAFWRVLLRLERAAATDNAPEADEEARAVMDALSRDALTLYHRRVINTIPRQASNDTQPPVSLSTDTSNAQRLDVPMVNDLPITALSSGPPMLSPARSISLFKDEPLDDPRDLHEYGRFMTAGSSRTQLVRRLDYPSDVPPFVAFDTMGHRKKASFQVPAPASASSLVLALDRELEDGEILESLHTPPTKRKRADATPDEEPLTQRSHAITPEILHDNDVPMKVLSPLPDVENHMRIWREYPAIQANPRPILANGLRPIVWATTRQELCESLPWFRTYQAGVYSHDGLTHGYLLAAAPAPRDAFLHNGKVIISHGGGGSEMVEAEVDVSEVPVVVGAAAESQNVHLAPQPSQKFRVLKQTKDQLLEASRVRPLLNTCKNAHPVLLVAHRKYALFPYELSVKMTFVVLGWYSIVSVWEEAVFDPTAPKGYWTRTKLKFQWIDSQGEPWWLQHSSERALVPLVKTKVEASSTPTTTPRKVMEVSLARPSISPDIQRCSRCNQPARQVYMQGWMCLNTGCRLFWRLPCMGISPHGNGLVYHPEFAALESQPNTFPLMTYTHLPGWCTCCGRLSCRRHWEAWVCECCGIVRPVNMPVYSAKELDAPVMKLYTVHDPTIRMDRFTIRLMGDGLALVHRFMLPLDRGTIYHILCSDSIRSTVDELLERCQLEIKESASFRRQVLSRNRIEGMLTQYFSQNYGVPYKYVAGTGTTIPFSEAHSFVKDSLGIITRHTRRIVESVRFNEVLVAAYMHADQMNYHSDCEDGLRGDIGTLSLGSPAQMLFRPMRNTLQNERSTEKTPRRKCLALTLRHGDVLLMHGIGIQENYEHTVLATGLRIAATARYIDNKV